MALSITNKLNIVSKVVHDRNNQYIITISKNQLSNVQNLIKDHMHPSMFYKIDMKKDMKFYFNYEQLNIFKNTVVYYGDILD